LQYEMMSKATTTRGVRASALDVMSG
jgi:hypothetical protein